MALLETSQLIADTPNGSGLARVAGRVNGAVRRLFTAGSRLAPIAALLIAGLLGGGVPVAASGAVRASVVIETTVTTRVPNFEFNAYFAETQPTISCELDNHLKGSGATSLTVAYCMSSTARLVHHVTLSSSGVVKTCVGTRCGSNPGLGTPNLAPGTKVRSGLFTCVISKKAVTCTVAGGRGFSITLSTIRVL